MTRINYKEALRFLETRVSTTHEQIDEVWDHCQRSANLTIKFVAYLHLDSDEMFWTAVSALFHDSGKFCIAEYITCKHGPLSGTEKETMKTHVGRGAMLLMNTNLGKAVPGVYLHHEHWNGTGYPFGISGQEIPIMARIVSIVDVWDSLTTKRAYKNAWTDREAQDEMNRRSGEKFDPELLAVFWKFLKSEDI